MNRTLVRVFIAAPQMKKGSSLSEVGGEAQFENIVHVSMDLIKSDAFKRIFSLDASFRKIIARLTLPSSLGKGIFVVPDVNVANVKNAYEKYSQEREANVEEYINVAYDSDIEKAKVTHGVLFNPSDYPTKSELFASFRTNIRYLSIGEPSDLKDIDINLFNQELSKATEAAKQEAEAWRALLCEEILDITNYLISRFTSSDGMEKKKLRNDMIPKVLESLVYIRRKNITNNTSVDKSIKELEGKLANVDIKNPGSDITEFFSGIRSSIIDSMSTGHRRMINR